LTAVDLRHTYELDRSSLAAIRQLCVESFSGGAPEYFDGDDWDHALGGIHAIAREGDTIVGHASVVQRRLLHGGRALRTGYVEAVAVRPDRQRRGIGATVMRAIAPVIERGYEIGALAAGPDAGRLYMALGWQQWRGTTGVLTPEGIERTPDDDDGIYVLPLAATLDLDGDLVCDWRDGDVW
jgi:aminoglycoside 2'-N-acetyltransferase I